MIRLLLPVLLRPLAPFVPFIPFAVWGLAMSANYLVPDGPFAIGLSCASLALCLVFLCDLYFGPGKFQPARPFTPTRVCRPHECAATRWTCRRLAKALRERFRGDVPKPKFAPGRHEGREVLHVIWQDSDEFMALAFVADRDGNGGAFNAFPHQLIYSVPLMADAMLIAHAIQAIAQGEQPRQFDSPTPPGH